MHRYLVANLSESKQWGDTPSSSVIICAKIKQRFKKKEKLKVGWNLYEFLPSKNDELSEFIAIYSRS